MKTLANCRPSEFLAQTNKIRKSVSKWLTATDIANIRKRMPELPEDVEEKDRKEAFAKQAKENLSAILDAILDEHPEETLELMALLCFVEPEDVDSHPVGEYIMAINELLQDETTVSFFTSLTSLARMSTKMG